MTENPGQPSLNGPGRHGRHYRNNSRRNRALTIITLVIAVFAAAGLVTWVVRSQATADSTTASASGGTAGSAVAGSQPAQGADQGAGGCPLSDGTLNVAAAPDIADVIGAITGSGKVAGCSVTVTTVDPAAVVASGPAGADVWIPDSSIWVERAAAAGVQTPGQHPSLANSPVVLALSGAAAAQLAAAGGTPNFAGILASRQSATPIRVGLPDPQQSAPAVAAILAAQPAVAGTADARAALTWAVRSSPADLPIHSTDLLDRLAADPNTAVPVGERAVVEHNAAAGATPVVAVYPGSGGVALDYPLVALSTDPGVTTAAAGLASELAGTPALDALQAAGFRAPDGSAGPTMSAGSGIDPATVVTAPMPALSAVDDAVRTVQVTNEPSRMLAVMDISGSMEGVVPDANGATRLDLAKQAAIRGLGLYTASSDIGLWVFSRTLTPTTDYRELIPVSTLGPDGQGGSGAQRLAAALNGIQAIPDGGTGLYDTTLAAVREMRANYDPTRVNSVLILSDGMNDDAGSISLDTLLSTLTAEQDPNHPIPVITIAFGPDSDLDAMTQISKATGGVAYEAKDPRQIGEIFLDAVGQRLCRPSC